MTIRLLHGACEAVLPALDAASIDACVTDPPYGLKFMGKKWDAQVPTVEAWREVYRVLKPGAHLLAFGGTRTYHRLVCAIEDAGFEIRDQLAWIFGSGFPKSLNLDEDHEGWGTALKPAHEPIVLARKPLEGTVAENMAKYGTGALNIDSCRISTEEILRPSTVRNDIRGGKFAAGHRPADDLATFEQSALGRWPANVLHDGSDEVLDAFPDAPGQIANASSSSSRKNQNCYGAMKRGNEASAQRRYAEVGSTNFAALPGARRGDEGSAARFFKECNFTDEEWLCQNLLLASGADECFNLQNELVVFALNRAATEALREGSQCVVSKAPSTSVTASELRQIATALIETTHNFAAAFSRASKHAAPILRVSRAKAVAATDPIGITMITISHWKSDGSAEPVTFNITATNAEAGEAASRFKYCAKASREDREDGLAHIHEKLFGMSGGAAAAAAAGRDYEAAQGLGINGVRKTRNNHPTVKPTELMRYLCRLITPPGGAVLDPFMGSGSTGRGAFLEGFNFIGIERDAQWLPIAEARIRAISPLFAEVSA